MEWNDRWPRLYEALLAPPTQFEGHWFGDEAPPGTTLESLGGLPWIRSSTKLSTEGYQCYPMDRASALAALALPLSGKHQIVDLCAAPGGKSLILARRMEAEAQLVVNEPSRARRERLKQVLSNYLPDSLRNRVILKGLPGEVLARKSDLQPPDAILLDAPCSSERHVLQQNPDALVLHTARSRELQTRQWMLLSNALHWLRPGGHLLYSTCSISSGENEHIIARALNNRKFLVEEVAPPPWILADFERRDHGYLILPDASPGLGPIYLCLLQKRH